MKQRPKIAIIIPRGKIEIIFQTYLFKLAFTDQQRLSPV